MAEIVTAVGRKWIAERIVGLRSSVDMYIGWGTDDTEATIDDTTLGTEQDRDLATASQSAGNARLSLWAKEFDISDVISSGTITPKEVALFDASSGGNMLYRRDIGGISLNPTQTMLVNIILSTFYYVGGGADWMDGIITDAGVAALSAMLLNNSPGNAFTVMGFGTGTTSEAAGNTALATEVERVAARYEFISKLSLHDTIRYSGVFSEVASDTVVSEIGIFNALSSGTLFWRDVLSSTITIPAGVTPILYADMTLVGDAP